MNPAQACNIEDLRTLARRRLPRIVRDYLEGGAEDEQTLRANRAAFAEISFAPRVLVDVSQRSQEVVVLGQRFGRPFGISPVGAAGLFRHEADIALARAAQRHKVPFILSTHAFVPFARVAEAAGATPWFQLYMANDRAAVERTLRQVRDAGGEVIVVTVDVPVGGNREYNERNGFCIPFRLGLSSALDGLCHPAWLQQVFLRFLLRGALPANGIDWGARRDALSWADFSWLREAWPGKLVIKGILGSEDAQLAVRYGADGVLVSNHGGRQLDGAPATIDILPEIVAAVGKRIAVLVDGGFRRGSDIVKALALGADMVFVGRPAIYGVTVDGERGACRALAILGKEVDRVMALLGCSSIAELGTQILHCPPPRRERPGKADAGVELHPVAIGPNCRASV